MLRLDAALFWTEARELIEPRLILIEQSPNDSIPNLVPKIQLQNVTRARIAGLDAAILAAPIPDRLIATLSYTYLSTRRQVAGDTSAAGPLAFRPRHLVTLSGDYSLGAFGVGADFRYASRVERIELEGFVDSRRVPVRVLDLRAGWKQGPVELRLLAANVLNYMYNLVPQTLAPVRTVTRRMSKKLSSAIAVPPTVPLTVLARAPFSSTSSRTGCVTVVGGETSRR